MHFHMICAKMVDNNDLTANEKGLIDCN